MNSLFPPLVSFWDQKWYSLTHILCLFNFPNILTLSLYLTKYHHSASCSDSKLKTSFPFFFFPLVCNPHLPLSDFLSAPSCKHPVSLFSDLVFYDNIIPFYLLHSHSLAEVPGHLSLPTWQFPGLQHEVLCSVLFWSSYIRMLYGKGW